MDIIIKPILERWKETSPYMFCNYLRSKTLNYAFKSLAYVHPDEKDTICIGNTFCKWSYRNKYDGYDYLVKDSYNDLNRLISTLSHETIHVILNNITDAKTSKKLDNISKDNITHYIYDSNL